MAKIVRGPKPRHVACRTCGAIIEYLPEEVNSRTYSAMDEPSGVEYVKCPREKCPGEGIIRSW